LSSPGQGPLPTLDVADFGPGQLHVAQAFVQDKVFAILRGDDPALSVLPNLTFAEGDPYLYVFVHGGDEVTRFQNWVDSATHEIPVPVVARLLVNHFGPRLNGALIRLCVCYGNLLRPGDSASVDQLLARELPQALFEGYHGLVMLLGSPPEVSFGLSVVWDPQAGPVVTGPPGNWEPIFP
jgi:hypothetical protein